ncbi:potassium transporter 5-like [Gossypium australe]|uniref:Potassium transporter 5-like n=1 Tax=Gossypium australe TaxID=47621 RepID=A0A5B6V1N7_9ROSI|nr:potassium transporter 5-like [Gossypium australe]
MKSAKRNKKNTWGSLGGRVVLSITVYSPLTFAAFLMIVRNIWNEIYRKKYYYKLDHHGFCRKVRADNHERISVQFRDLPSSSIIKKIRCFIEFELSIKFQIST